MISKNIAKGLTKEENDSPKSPHFYPKPHKEGVPERPVRGSVNCHIVDYHFQPIVPEILSMLKTQVTSNETLAQLNSSHPTPNSYHLKLSYYTQAFPMSKM